MKVGLGVACNSAGLERVEEGDGMNVGIGVAVGEAVASGPAVITNLISSTETAIRSACDRSLSPTKRTDSWFTFSGELRKFETS